MRFLFIWEPALRREGRRERIPVNNKPLYSYSLMSPLAPQILEWRGLAAASHLPPSLQPRLRSLVQAMTGPPTTCDVEYAFGSDPLWTPRLAKKAMVWWRIEDSETSGRQSSRERPLASVLGSLQLLSHEQMTLTLNAGL